LAASGEFTADQIAEQLDVSHRQFFYWLTALKQGGVEGLLVRKHGGGVPASVQGPMLEELREGLRKGPWKRAREIQRWLADRHQVQMGTTGVYYWLGKLGGVLKVPRKTHAKKDAAQSAEFRQTLCAKLKSLNVAGGRPVRIWVAERDHSVRRGEHPVERRQRQRGQGSG
ncbi:MAG: winged helix-turn-helix domain-containing protein, partial [Kiritimatiellaeota bacterium]|nr:winged helix-turn-helix domain-containing protein [Kiritimatiellota bacterium]